jgi:hypothetical protein
VAIFKIVPTNGGTSMGKKIWIWPVVATCASIIWGFGVAAMYGDDYKIAVALYFSGIALLAAKFLTWEEHTGYSRLKKIGLWIGTVVVAMVAFLASLYWIQVRKQDVIAGKTIGASPSQREQQLKEQYGGFIIRIHSMHVDKHGKQILKPNGDPDEAFGTAFLVKKGTAITYATNVKVENWDFSDRLVETIIGAKVARCMLRPVLQLPGILFCKVDPKLKATIPMFSDEVFSGDVVTLMGYSTWPGDLTPRSGKVEQLVGDAFTVRMRNPPGGTDGSPVFNAFGQVVGMQVKRTDKTEEDSAVGCIKLPKQIDRLVQ